MTLDGILPDDVYYDKKPEKPKRSSKTVPFHIDQHLFRETRINKRMKKNPNNSAKICDKLVELIFFNFFQKTY